MVKVILTIEGEPSEIPSALRALLQGSAGETGAQVEVRRRGRRRAGPTVEPTEEAVGARPGWAPGEFRRFWRRLRPDARRILKEIARRPEGYPADELARSLGFSSGREIGGRLSSVGHRMRGFPGKPEPVERVRTPQGPVYRMDPQMASLVSQAEG